MMKKYIENILTNLKLAQNNIKIGDPTPYNIKVSKNIKLLLTEIKLNVPVDVLYWENWKQRTGIGKRAICPWIGVKPKRSKSDDFGVAIIFSQDHSSVFIGIMQESESFFGDKEALIQRKKELNNVLNTTYADMNFETDYFENLLLDSKRKTNTRCNSYFFVSIIYKLIPVNDLANEKIYEILNKYLTIAKGMNGKKIPSIFKEPEITLGIVKTKESPNYNPNRVKVIDRRKHDDRIKEMGSVGEAAESFVVKFESRQLIKAGRPDLAAKVSMKDTNGDGYDVCSYFSDGKKKNIEVKGSNTSKNNYIFLTRNEYAKYVSKETDFIYYVSNMQDPLNIAINIVEIDEKHLVPTEWKIKLDL